MIRANALLSIVISLCMASILGCARPFGKGEQPLGQGRSQDVNFLFDYATCRVFQNVKTKDVVGLYGTSYILWDRTYGGYSENDPITVHGVVQGDRGAVTVWIKAYRAANGNEWYALSLGGLIRGAEPHTSFDLFTAEEYDELAQHILARDYVDNWRDDLLLSGEVKNSLRAGHQVQDARGIQGMPIFRRGTEIERIDDE